MSVVFVLDTLKFLSVYGACVYMFNFRDNRTQRIIFSQYLHDMKFYFIYHVHLIPKEHSEHLLTAHFQPSFVFPLFPLILNYSLFIK